MSLIIGLLVLGAIIAVVTWAVKTTVPLKDQPLTPEQAKYIELSRLELDLRALEHKVRTPDEDNAYAMLIQRRNALAQAAVPRRSKGYTMATR